MKAGENMVMHLRETRGEAVARTYSAWVEMRRRVRQPDPVRRNGCYVGVAISPRWDDFEAFLAGMGPCPPGLSLDRIDGTRGYEPGNCRWATALTQSRNRKYVPLSMEAARDIRRRYAAGRVSQQALANEYGVTQKMVSNVVLGRSWPEA